MNLPIVTALKQTSSPRQNTRLTARLSTTALAIVAASVLTLTGCSTDKDLKPVVHKANKLPALTAPSQTLALVHNWMYKRAMSMPQVTTVVFMRGLRQGRNYGRSKPSTRLPAV
jgi:hypothetical protein